MKKKLSLIITIVMIVTSICANASAYTLKSTQPGVNYWWYHAHSSTNSTMRTAMNDATNTWNTAGGDYPFNRDWDSSGVISFSDTFSEIGYDDLSNYPGIQSSAVAVCATVGNSYQYFDIIMDSQDSWKVQTVVGADTEWDYQGVLTHELGHAIGLDDLNYTGSLSGIPTMFKSVQWYVSGGYLNVSYSLRSLTQDDINGKIQCETLR